MNGRRGSEYGNFIESDNGPLRDASPCSMGTLLRRLLVSSPQTGMKSEWIISDSTFLQVLVRDRSFKFTEIGGAT